MVIAISGAPTLNIIDNVKVDHIKVDNRSQRNPRYNCIYKKNSKNVNI